MAEATGVELIAAERARQIAAEGYTVDHDGEHKTGQLGDAAWCYLTGVQERLAYPERPHVWQCSDPEELPEAWPWEFGSWKPTPDDPIRQLTKAGALIAAEIDRRLAAGSPSPERSAADG